VSLVEHAVDDRVPANTAWLIAGATAAAATSLAVVTTTMIGHPGRRLVPYAPIGTAAISVALAAIRPIPWALTLALRSHFDGS
jgi:hypothetical protein